MAMNTSEDTFHSFHDSFPVSPKRRSSPDHGFVFVGNDNDSADAPSQQELLEPPSGSMSRSSSQLQAANTGFSPEGTPEPARPSPAWMDRAMEQTRALLELDHTPSASDMLAAPGSQASLVGENAQLRTRLMELTAEHQWAMDTIVKGKDSEKADLAAALRDMTDQRDELEQELKHNEKEFVRLVADAMEEKLEQSFERFAVARGMLSSGLDAAPDSEPLPFDRLPEVLRRKSTEVGVRPRALVTMDSQGLPSHVSLDWTQPEHVLDAAQAAAPANAASAAAPAHTPVSQKKKRRGVGWPKPRPGVVLSHAKGGAAHVSQGAAVGVRAVPQGVRFVGAFPRRTVQGPVGRTVGHTVMQVQPAVAAIGSVAACTYLGVVNGLVGASRSVGSFAREQLAKLGSLSMRFARWLKQPDTVETLETYIGLALVLLTGYATLQLLKVQPPCYSKLGSRRSSKDPPAHPPVDPPASDLIQLSFDDSSHQAGDESASAPAHWAEFMMRPLPLSIPNLPPLPSLPEISIDEGDDGALIHIDGHVINLPRFMGGPCTRSEGPVEA